MARRDPEVVVVLVRGDVEVARWPLPQAGADLALVDELARLQLGARRLGCSIRLRGTCTQLVELLGLLHLLGLAQVVPREADLGVEPGGKAEDGEQPGVEEVVMPDDPVA